MNNPSLRCAALWRPSAHVEAVLFGLKLGQPVGQGVMPTALLDDAHDLRDSFRGFGKVAARGFR
jgi:hypothetical protein